MSITGGLLAFGVRYFFVETAEAAFQAVGEQLHERGRQLADAAGKAAGPVGDHLFKLIENRLTDHSQALPKALAKANDRAWEAVGLALVGDSWFDRLKDAFRDANMKGVRNQIKKFLDSCPTGLESATAVARAKATEDWLRLRKAKRLSAESVPNSDIARRAASMERHGDPARMTAAAHRAVEETADALHSEAPHLAELLTAAPDGGTPLLAAAFAFFFRREVEKNTELAHGLAFDYLRLINEGQKRAFEVLDARTEGILDQFDVLFESLEKMAAAQAAKQQAIHDDVVETKESVRELTEEFRAFLQRQSEEQKAGRKGPTLSSISPEERKLLLRLLAASRRNPNAFSADLLDRLGDTMSSERMFEAAGQAHEAAAAVAHTSANRDAEAAQHYKAYLSACDGGDWEKAAEFLWSAAKLRPDLYRPFHPNQFQFVRILGAGAFGTVFHCRNEWNEDVAIKSFRSTSLGEEAWTLRKVKHSAVIGVQSKGYGNPDAKTRPYIVMDFFPGLTLDQFAAENRPMKMSEFAFIAREVAEAVHAAHSLPEPVYHCDIKPANIMVLRKPDDSLVVKVIDFGLAKRTGAIQTSRGIPKDQLSTSEISKAGTERYAPPEQTGDLAGDIGPHSDVYAWGKTFLDMLFGHLQPGDEEWEVDEIPEPYRSTLKRLLAQCVRPSIDQSSRFPRLPNFDAVLAALAALDPTERESQERSERETQERQQQPEEAERQRVLTLDLERVLTLDLGGGHEEFEGRKSEEEEEAERLRKTAVAKKLKKRKETRLKEAELHRKATELEEAQREDDRQNRADQKRRASEKEDVRGLTSRRAFLGCGALTIGGSTLGAGGLWLLGDRTPKPSEPAIGNPSPKPSEPAIGNSSPKPSEPAISISSANSRNPGEVTTVNVGSVQFPFAWCPPGSFQMGSEHPEAMKEDWCKKTERPVHNVTLTKGFFMGIHPVTQAQWKAVMGTEPSHFKGPNRPVEQVSWDDCQEFCQKLTGLLKGKATVHLPTEAEWEYACRAGTTTEFWFGNVINPDLANYDGNYRWNGSPKGKDRKQTTDVGTVGSKNPWGLFDLHGNVWEWCQDAFDEEYYSKSPGKDPICTNDQITVRVLRGGSWYDEPHNCRSAFRLRGGRDYRLSDVGCRVCFRLDG